MEQIQKIKKYLPILVSAVFIIYFCYRKFYFKSGQLSISRIATVIMITLVLCGISCVPQIRNRIKEHPVVSEIIALCVIPIAAFWSSETVCAGIIWTYGMRRLFLNMVIIYSIVGALLVLTNSVRMSLFIYMVLITLFDLVNHYVKAFRGSPIIAADLYSITTALSVSNNYEYTIKYKVFRCLFIAVALGFLIFCLPKHKAMERKKRIAFCALWFVCCTIFYGVFFQTNYIKNHMNLEFSAFHPSTTYRKQGSLLTFLYSIKKMQIAEPKEYNEEELYVWMEEYLLQQTSDEEGNESAAKPNIIVVMDEAFADFSGEVAMTEDNTPFLHSLQAGEDIVYGNLYPSVFGGGTANTEFEMLTGNTVGFLPTNIVAYAFFVHGEFPSLTRSLVTEGYTGNLAIHPYEKRGFNRPRAYAALGFSEFLSQDAFENPLYVRKYISDYSDFEKIIENYEQVRASGDESPYYVFNVTMQNHSGYDVEGYETPIKLTDTDKFPEAEQYINLIKESDTALQSLVSYFQNVPEKTVIVFFGDHRPGLSDDFYNYIAGEETGNLTDEKETELKYKIPFFIWANYDIEEQYIECISANYLSGILCEICDIPMTGYQKYLEELRQTIPSISARGYWDADGNYYDVEDEDSPYYETIQKYRCIQYNNMFGNRYEPFFRLDVE